METELMPIETWMKDKPTPVPWQDRERVTAGSQQVLKYCTTDAAAKGIVHGVMILSPMALLAVTGGLIPPAGRMLGHDVWIDTEAQGFRIEIKSKEEQLDGRA